MWKHIAVHKRTSIELTSYVEYYAGKTVLIRALKKYCDSIGVTCDLTASTGKASSAIGGVTIHSYIGLTMTQNDEAESKEDALKLSKGDKEFVIKPNILIIDEASMIGRKVFHEIDKCGFDYVLFVMDSSQLPPVKEKKMVWQTVVNKQYKLTKTLRATEPRMMQLFEDARRFKHGEMPNFQLADYVNGDNIVLIDYDDIDYMPTNTESCCVAYRNRLVENLVEKTTSDGHTLYNLNCGVTKTLMIAISDVPNEDGYFTREFKNRQAYYNGEDVHIVKLDEQTRKLVADGRCKYKNFTLTLARNKKSIMVTDNTNPIPYNAKEAKEDKQFIKLPKQEILENCSLSIINDGTFILLWDKTEDEYDAMLEYYFSKLLPYIRIMRMVRKHDLDNLPYHLKLELSKLDKKYHVARFKEMEEGFRYTSAWSEFLSASAVVSARPTTSRTIHKAQGISVPCVVITDLSFFGATMDAQYVAMTRGKHGVILVKNTPKHLVQKGNEDV